MKRVVIVAFAAMTGMAAGPTLAESPPLPSPVLEEILVKTSLLTLNDANLTGNFDVLYAKMGKPFRDRFTADALKQAFKSFAGRHIEAVVTMPIVQTSPPRLGGNGGLMLRGYFDTRPSRLSYELDFAVSEGEWKPVAIDVKVRSQAVSEAEAIDLVAHAAANMPGEER